MYYSIEDCDNVLFKLAAIGAGAPAQPPATAYPPAGGMDPAQQQEQLGTIGQDMGGQAQGQGQAQGPQGFKANKDHLYERLIQEKDNLADLKMRLASSGQLPAEMGQQQQQAQQQAPPLEQQMQQGMSQDMAMQQEQMAQPQEQMAQQQPDLQGLQAQASALKKKLEQDYLNKEAILPALAGLALKGGALYGGYQLAKGLGGLAAGAARGVGSGVEYMRAGAAKNQMDNNPLITRDVVESEFRRQSTPSYFGNLESSRNLFGSGNEVPHEFVNKYAPKIPGASGSTNKAAYNGVGR